MHIFPNKVVGSKGYQSWEREKNYALQDSKKEESFDSKCN